MSGLDKNNSGTIGFVYACLFHQAISLEELKEWAVHIVSTYDDYPDYVVDLMEYDGPLFKFTNIVGFVPVWDRDKEDEHALYGIAYKRGVDVVECPIEKDEALDAIARNPRIEKLFFDTFPFVSSLSIDTV